MTAVKKPNAARNIAETEIVNVADPEQVERDDRLRDARSTHTNTSAEREADAGSARRPPDRTTRRSACSSGR